MLDSLLIHQGSGLNNLFLTAEAAPPLYNKNENHTAYQLCKDCFLSIAGNHTEPLGQLLNPDACKLLDILVSDLGAERPYPILLSLENYMQLTGRSISESKKNDSPQTAGHCDPAQKYDADLDGGRQDLPKCENI